MNLTTQQEKAIEICLKTQTIPSIAQDMGVSYSTLHRHIKSLGISVADIKRKHKQSVLGAMAGRYTLREMARVSGYSESSITTYANQGHTYFKCSGKW